MRLTEDERKLIEVLRETGIGAKMAGVYVAQKLKRDIIHSFDFYCSSKDKESKDVYLRCQASDLENLEIFRLKMGFVNPDNFRVPNDKIIPQLVEGWGVKDNG